MRRVCLAAAAVLLVTACGLGDKAALEDRITAAPGRAEGVVVSGTITVESRLMKVPEGGAGGGFGGFAPVGLPSGDTPDFPEDGVPFGSDTVEFSLDLESGLAVLNLVGAAEPYAILDDFAFYGRRVGVPDTDARPWVRVDLARLSTAAGSLDPFTDDATIAISALHPMLLVDLVAGTLTGSIEEIGTETIGGVPAQGYDVNVALDKAYDDQRRSRYPEDRREVVTDVFEALGLEGNVNPGEVWLDDDGQLRRFRVEFTQEPVRRVEFALIFTLEITAVDGTIASSVPSPESVLSVDTIVRFAKTVTPRTEDGGGPFGGGEFALPEGAADLLGGGADDGAGTDAPDGADPADPSATPATTPTTAGATP